MKIMFKKTEAPFGSLDFGESFVIDGCVYIKTEPNLQQQLPSYGCGLDDGHLRYFKGEDYVHPITMEAREV